MPIILIFIIVVIILIVYGAKQSAKLRQEREEWARSRGLSFEPGRDYGFKDRYPAFGCLRRGDGDRYAYNIVRGRLGSRGVVMFDYHYESESTDSKGRRTTTDHHFSAAVIESDLPLQPLSIRAEGLLDKITAFFGHEDINFESAEFSKKFHVTSPDRKWAYDVLHQRTMEFMLQRPAYTLQFEHDCVIAYRNSRFSVTDFDLASDLVQGILDALPEYVVKQQREGENLLRRTL